MKLSRRLVNMLLWTIVNIVLCMWLWHYHLTSPNTADPMSTIETRLASSTISMTSPPLLSTLQSSVPMPEYRTMFRADVFRSYTGLYHHNSSGKLRSIRMLTEFNGTAGWCDIDVGQRRTALEEYGLPSFRTSVMDIEGGVPQLKRYACDAVNSSLNAAIPVKSGMVVVLTTCNQLGVTVQTIQYLEKSSDPFDVLVIDDHSIDGTYEYLTRRGYAVIRNTHPQGLTHSWNIGYRVARDLGYEYLIVINNDVLVPEGAMAVLQQVLSNETLVVPVTTPKGAGHNPAQSLLYAHGLNMSHSDYLDNPSNADKVQRTLSRKFERSANRLKLSEWNGRVKFNGFFFGVNMAAIRPAVFDSDHLFDPDTVMVDQEDRLTARMARHGLVPKICPFVFIFHFKSATVKASNYILGSKTETRNDLSLYHPELSTPNSTSSFSFLSLKVSPPTLRLYPPSESKAVIAMAVSNPATHPNAGDIFTARELGNALEERFSVEIRYLYRNVNWYEVENVDVVVAFLDQYRVTSLRNTKPSLITVAWMRNWFSRWLSCPWIGNYNLLLTSSAVAASFFKSFEELSVECNSRCPSVFGATRRRLPIQVGVLRIATNPLKFSPGTRSSKFFADYSFTGNYWEVPRDIMALDPGNLSEYKGVIVGKNWNTAPVSSQWKRMIHRDVPYRLMPMVYRSSKIVIDDANHVTKPWGSVNSRVYDALACGTLVITNGILGSADTFGRELPTYSNMTELTKKLRLYLSNDTLRQQLADRLYHEVMNKHTYTNRADEFVASVNSVTQFPLLRPRESPTDASFRDHEGTAIFSNNFARSRRYSDPGSLQTLNCTEEQMPSICVGVRVAEGHYENWLGVLLEGLLAQHSGSTHRSTLDLLLFIINTDEASSNFLTRLHNTVDRVNGASGRCNARVLWDTSMPARQEKNKFYGYDTSDMLLDYLTSKTECEWIMFTNGDNMYNMAWFDTVAPYAKKPELSIIGWDFVSHHPRKGGTEQPIRIALKRRYVDLGSVLIRSRELKRIGAEFMPDSIFTQDLFARDFFLVDKVVKSLNASAVKLLHKRDAADDLTIADFSWELV